MKTLLFLLLVGCGPSWTATDTKNATDSANCQLQLEVICGRGPDDAGTCNAASVRSLERASWCATGSMLSRHEAALPDAGIACKAPGK
jgi:hypothetical protein